MHIIIKGIRNLRGLTQQQLSEKLGISKRTYCIKENNPDQFTVKEIRELAEILEVEETIFFGKEVTVMATL